MVVAVSRRIFRGGVPREDASNHPDQIPDLRAGRHPAGIGDVSGTRSPDGGGLAEFDAFGFVPNHEAVAPPARCALGRE